MSSFLGLFLTLVATALPVQFARAGISAPPPPNEILDRVAALRAEIAHHDHLYFVEAAPEISDEAYDRLKSELHRLESTFPRLAQTSGNPLSAFADDRSEASLSAPHLTAMGSLKKAHGHAEIEAFDRHVRQSGDGRPVAYIVEPKYDGMAVNLIYEAGHFIRALSRGDGTSGEELTDTLRLLPGFPRILRGPHLPTRLELRGELYLPWAAYNRLQSAKIGDGEAASSTPRSATVGAVRTGDPQLVRDRGILLVVFAKGAWEPLETAPTSQSALRETLLQWGFAVPQPVRQVTGGKALVKVVEGLTAQRAALPFPADGLVLKVDQAVLQRRLGAGADAPHWALAYKFPAPQRRTRLRGLDFRVGRTGRLTPVAQLAPVEIAGATVRQASLHHSGRVRALRLHVGDTVQVEMAGGLIPQIIGVDARERPQGARLLEIPLDCPDCGHRLDATSKIQFCRNYDCPSRLAGRLEHFAQTLGLPGLGPSTIAQLLQEKTWNHLAELYLLPAKSLPAELSQALVESRQVPLGTLLTALSIPEFGPRKAHRLADHFDNFETFVAANDSELAAAIDSASAAESLLRWRRHPTVREMLTTLLAEGFNGPLETGPPAAPRTGPLAGLTFVFTGRLPTLTRAQASARAEAGGAFVRPAVSGTTDYLVAGELPGSAVQAARSRSVPILTEEEFLNLLKTAEGAHKSTPSILEGSPIKAISAP